MQVFGYFHSHPFYGDLYIKKGFKQKEDFSTLVLSILSTIIGHKRHRDISAPALSDIKILTNQRQTSEKLWYFDDWHKVFYPPLCFFQSFNWRYLQEASMTQISRVFSLAGLASQLSVICVCTWCSIFFYDFCGHLRSSWGSHLRDKNRWKIGRWISDASKWSQVLRLVLSRLESFGFLCGVKMCQDGSYRPVEVFVSSCLYVVLGKWWNFCDMFDPFFA